MYYYNALSRMIKQENADGTSLSYKFDVNGRIIQSTNEEGNSMRYTYDNNGQMFSITDYMGCVTEYRYTKPGQIKTVKDAEGGITAYEYDFAGNISSVIDPEGYVTSYEYDADNRLTVIIDPRGGVTKNCYDERGNLTIKTQADGGVTYYFYDLTDRLIKFIDPEGHVFRIEYDDKGNVLKEVDGRGNSKQFIYDNTNRVIEVINEAGFSSHKEYDADNRLIKHVNEEGAITYYEYDKRNQITKISDALGHSTVFNYDSMGRVITKIDARGAVTHYEYTLTGAISKITDALNGITSYFYNTNGLLIRETNPNAETIFYEYDKLGRVTKKTDPLGNSETFVYDANSRTTSYKDKNGNTTAYVYDPNGNITQTINAMNGVSEFTYDMMNRLVSVSRNRIDVMNGINEQQVTRYEYNMNGWLIKRTNAVGDHIINAYDQNGNLIRTSDEDGYVSNYSYDPRNLISLEKYADAKTVNYAYNKAGELIKMTDWNGTNVYTLDLLGRITKVNSGDGRTVSYDYDAVSNQTRIIYPDNTTVNYEYDLLDRMIRLTDDEKQVTTYSYDHVRLVGLNYANGWNESYVYDVNGQLLKQNVMRPDQKSNQLFERFYRYDPNGNLLREYGNCAGNRERFDKTHSYDELDKLTKTTGLTGGKTHEYAYDSLGNLIRELINDKEIYYRYNSLNQQVWKSSDDDGVYASSFDKRGNFIKGVYKKNDTESFIDCEYVYNSTNRMIKGTNRNNEQSRYIYNGFGDLIANEWIVSTHGSDGAEDAEMLVIDHNRFTVIRKDYVLDYTKSPRNNIMEIRNSDGLVCRHVYGLDKAETVIHCKPDSTFSRVRSIDKTADNNAFYKFKRHIDGEIVPVIDETAGCKAAGKLANAREGQGANMTGLGKKQAVKLFCHQDHLGTTDYLSDSINGSVFGSIACDDWGARADQGKRNISAGDPEFTRDYTGHPYDIVLGVYYAMARMYDADNRRFMAVDPAFQQSSFLSQRKRFFSCGKDAHSMAQYTYCENNPHRFVDPLGAWGISVHLTRTESWAKDKRFTESEAQEIARTTNSVDFNPETMPFIKNDKNSSWHYDIEQYRNGEKDSRLWRFRDQCNKALDILIKNHKVLMIEALREFARGLHPLQDYYAHLDWNPYEGFHKAYFFQQNGVYSEANADSEINSLFDNINYDLKKEIVTFKTEKILGSVSQSASYPKARLYQTEEILDERNIYVALYNAYSTRYLKARRATETALEAFKKVYASPADESIREAFKQFLENIDFKLNK